MCAKPKPSSAVPVSASGAVDTRRALEAQQVQARPAVQPVAAHPAVKDIVAGVATETVLALLAVQRVVAAQAAKDSLAVKWRVC